MRNKYLVLVSVVVVLAVGAGGGFWFLNHHKKGALNDGAASINTSVAAPTTPGGLGVTGNATNLGQLGGNTSQSGSQATPSAGSSTAPSNSSTSRIDPSTFAQYDKYKDNPTVLFGDAQVGSGATLAANQQATILYKGWLTNGTLFDQSRTDSSGRLQPLAFTVGAHQVIPGMEEGVVGMKVGGTRLIIIPPGLGYGAAGQGAIPGNAVLVFEVELLDTK